MGESEHPHPHCVLRLAGIFALPTFYKNMFPLFLFQYKDTKHSLGNA